MLVEKGLTTNKIFYDQIVSGASNFKKFVID